MWIKIWFYRQYQINYKCYASDFKSKLSQKGKHFSLFFSAIVGLSDKSKLTVKPGNTKRKKKHTKHKCC